MWSNSPQGQAGSSPTPGAAAWALEATTDFVVLLDREFRITYINRAAAELNSLTVEEAIGRTNWEVWPSILGTDVERAYREAMTTGEPRRFEQHYIEEGGLNVWLEVHAYPSPDGLAIFFRDISEAKRQAAREAEDRERLASAMRATDLGTWRCELPLDGTPFYWSPQVRRHFGISEDEEVGVKEFLELLHPDDREPTAQAMTRAIEERVPYDVLYRTLGRDGRMRWIRATGNAFYREDGTPYRFDGFTVDLTERIETEQALRDAKARSEATLASGDVGTWVFDTVYDRVYADANIVAMFGVDDRQANGGSVSDFIERVHPEDQPIVREAIARSIREGAAYDIEYRVLNGDREVWVLARGIPEKNAAGHVVRLPGIIVDITARKTAQAARLLSEERYRTLFESIDEGFGVIEVVFDESGNGVDYRFLEVNPAFERMSGVPIEAALSGRTMREMYPSFERYWANLYGQVANTGVSVSVTDHSPALGRWFEVQAVRTGTVGSGLVAVVFKDVTEQRQADVDRERLMAELTAERARLYQLFQMSPSAIAVLHGPDLVFEYANPAYRAMFTQGADVVGKPLAEVLPEAFDQGFDRLLRDVMATGVPFRHPEAPFTMRATAEAPEQTVYVDFVYQPMADANGATTGVFAHIVDVTAQVLAREAAVKSEERFRAVLETTPDPFTILEAVRDHDGEIVDFTWTFVNEATGRLTGETAEELVGALVSERRPGIRETELYAHWLHTLATGEPFSHETFMNFPSGRTYVRLTGVRVGDGIATSFTDLTQRRLNEERLEAVVSDRTAELQTAVKEAEGFNYSVAHDLRAPLRAVSSTAGILLEEAGPELTEEHRMLLARQAENANRLGRLIDELLRLSRLSRAEVRRQPLDMTAKVRSVFNDLLEEGRSNGCVLEVQEGMTAEGDAGLVRTVLHNLLGNACKFSPTGGTVRVGQVKDAFFIQDEGVGFDIQFAPKIFLPFERLVTDAEFEGTGIGLANVDRIVRRHGGHVWAESEPGQGSTFWFTLV